MDYWFYLTFITNMKYIHNYCNFEIDDQSRTKVFVCQSDDLRKLNIRIEGYCRNRWAGEQGEFYTRLREV